MYKYFIFLMLIFSLHIETSVQHLSQEKEFTSLLSQHNYVIVDFYADWCRPCKSLSPILESLSQEYKQITFAKLNIDQVPNIAQKYNVQSIPTLLFFKNGILVDRMVGLQNKTDMRNKIEKNNDSK